MRILKRELLKYKNKKYNIKLKIAVPPMEQLFKKALIRARDNRYATGQFNVSNSETLKAIFDIAGKLNAPVIIGTSEGERKFLGRRQIVKLVGAYREEMDIPVILNADHSHSVDEAKKAVDAGYGMVHFDGQGLPLDENIKQTKEVFEYARSKNPDILVEGELGYVRGGSAVHEAADLRFEEMTDPEEVARFIKETGVDALAVAIGNVHGIVKGGNPRLDIERLKRIKEKAGKTFLVLHGASGVADEDIKEAIKAGVVKINVNTELRLAYIEALRKFLNENPEETTPYKIFPSVIEAIAKIVENKIKLFQEKI